MTLQQPESILKIRRTIVQGFYPELKSHERFCKKGENNIGSSLYLALPYLRLFTVFGNLSLFFCEEGGGSNTL